MVRDHFNSYYITTIGSWVEEVLFFEAPLGESPEKEDREYVDSFYQPEARSIYYELNLLHPLRTEGIEFTVNAMYYFPNGEKMGEYAWESHAEADWDSSWHSAGYGWEEAGNWELGSHKIEIYIDDELVYTGWFEVYR